VPFGLPRGITEGGSGVDFRATNELREVSCIFDQRLEFFETVGGWMDGDLRTFAMS
jgi:hypothetical protein